MFTNQLKTQLAEDGVAFGAFVQIAHPAVVEAFAAAGVRWIILDCEHGVLDLEAAANLMRGMSAWQCDAIVRLPGNDRMWIARCLDAGARGIIVPMVNTPEQAEAAVAAAKYPPAGKRGFGFGRANHYGVEFDAYLGCANDQIAVIVQIEHIKGVENADAILSVEGIDGVFVGPYDLSGSLGIPGKLDDPKMLEALERINQACDRHNVPAGVHITSAELDRVERAIAGGFRILALGVDTQLLYHAMHDFLRGAKALVAK